MSFTLKCRKDQAFGYLWFGCFCIWFSGFTESLFTKSVLNDRASETGEVDDGAIWAIGASS
ncbi:hypothetical protein [Phormidesmis sp. 146-33]